MSAVHTPGPWERAMSEAMLRAFASGDRSCGIAARRRAIAELAARAKTAGRP